MDIDVESQNKLMVQMGLPAEFSTKRISRRKKKAKQKGQGHDDGVDKTRHAKHDDMKRDVITEKAVRYEDLIPVEKTDAPQCVKDLVKKVLELNNRHTFDPQAANETLLQFSRNVTQTIEYWPKMYAKILMEVGWDPDRKVFERRLSPSNLKDVKVSFLRMHQPLMSAKVSILDTDAIDECKRLVVLTAQIRRLKNYDWKQLKDQFVDTVRKMLEAATTDREEIYKDLLVANGWHKQMNAFTSDLSREQIEFIGLKLIEIHQPIPTIDELVEIGKCDCFLSTKKYVKYIDHLCGRPDFDSINQKEIAEATRKVFQEISNYEKSYAATLIACSWNNKIKIFKKYLGLHDLHTIAVEFTKIHQPGAVPGTKKKKQLTEEEKAAKKQLEWVLNTYRLPISHEAILKGHKSKVSCMALDKKGSRLVTGGWDSLCKMYAFAGMDERLNSFKTIEPREGRNPIISLSYSPNSSHFLCVNASCIPRIYDREGEYCSEFVRGDNYLRDLYKTKGHIVALSGGKWHPKDKSTVITWSLDGTARYWDIEEQECTDVIKAKPRAAERQQVTSAALSNQLSKLTLGCRDGSIQVFDCKSSLRRPKVHIKLAHEPMVGISDLLFEPASDVSLYSRGGDHNIKVWDLRKATEPVQTWENLPNNSESTNLCFSPDMKYVITGTSYPRKGELGELVFFDRKKGSEIHRSPICDKGVTKVLWNAHINQIFMGCGDRKCRVLYNPTLSKKGALMCAKRKQKKKHLNQVTKYFEIHAPNDLPEFRKDMTPWKTQARKMKSDPGMYKIPFKPAEMFAVEDTNKKGWTEHVLEKARHWDHARKDNPREAILKWADKAKEDPIFTNIYAQSQPKRELDWETEEEKARKKKAKLDLEIFS